MEFLKVIDKYEGKSDATVWFAQLRVVAAMLKIENIQVFMPILLRGDAYAVFQHLDSKSQSNLDSLEAALSKAFSKGLFEAFDCLKNRKWCGESIDVYLADIRTLGKQAGASEQTIRCIFVLGLPDRIAQTLKTLPDIETIEMESLVAICRAMMVTYSNQASCVVATPALQGGKLTCDYCKRVGHTDDQCYRRNPTCYACGKAGHIRKDCPNSKSGNEGGVTRAPVCTPSRQ